MENRIQRLVDTAIELDYKISIAKAQLEAIKALIQTEAIAKMENTGTKFVQYFGERGNVVVTYKDKLEVENITKLKEMFGTAIEDKITREETVKYTLTPKAKEAIIALYKENYAEHNISEIIMKSGADAKSCAAIEKKLKGDYGKDIKTLAAFGIDVSDGFEEELDAIREQRNYEKVCRICNPSEIDVTELKRAVNVEENLAVGLSYDKEVTDGKTGDRAEAD